MTLSPPCNLGLWNTPTTSLQMIKTSPSNECPVNDAKLSDDEAPDRKVWRM